MQNNGWNIRLGRMVRLNDIKKRCKSSTVSITVGVYGTLEAHIKRKAEPFVKRTESAASPLSRT